MTPSPSDCNCQCVCCTEAWKPLASDRNSMPTDQMLSHCVLQLLCCTSEHNVKILPISTINTETTVMNASVAGASNSAKQIRVKSTFLKTTHKPQTRRSLNTQNHTTIQTAAAQYNSNCASVLSKSIISARQHGTSRDTQYLAAAAVSIDTHVMMSVHLHHNTTMCVKAGLRVWETTD